MALRAETIDVDTLESLEPMTCLPQPTLVQLAQQIAVEPVRAGQYLFREGDQDGKAVYLISGTVELFGRRTPPRRIVAGTPDSWQPLGQQQPRQCSAVALTDVQIIRVNMERIDHLLAWDHIAPANHGECAERFFLPQGQHRDWMLRLLHSPLFQQLPTPNIEALLQCLEPIVVSAGDVIFKQGDPGKYFYLIDKGVALISRRLEKSGREVEVAELGPGASFGEESLIADTVRQMTVTMETDGRLMMLSKPDFQNLMQEPLLNWLNMDELLVALSQDTQCLDVRLAPEFYTSHLATALNLPLNELRSRLVELDPRFHYVCYCNTGKRSAAAAYLLSQAGFRASVLRGGLQSVPTMYLI